MEINLTFIIQISNILICIVLLKKFLIFPILANLDNKKAISEKIAESNSTEIQLTEKIKIKSTQELDLFKQQALFLIEAKEPNLLQASDQFLNDFNAEKSNWPFVDAERKTIFQEKAKLTSKKLMEVINDC